MKQPVPQVIVEDVPCPFGCPRGDEHVLFGRDRLHDLPGEFGVVKCRTCGLMRTSPRPTADTIGFYYPDEYGPYQSSPVIKTSKRKKVYRWQILLKQLIDLDSRKVPTMQPGRMLEIGCASGSFLDQMTRSGWDVEGIEFSWQAASASLARGYAVHVGTVQTKPEPRKPYDLIVGWHVLEHLPDPVCTLKKLRQWTKPGGWLVLSMPDAGSWEFKIFRERWYGLDLPRHLFHYSPRTLKNLLVKCDWEIQDLFWHNNPNNLLQSFRWVCSDRGWNKQAQYVLEIVQSRRHRDFHRILAKLLGMLHASGRMTVWARRH